MMNEFFTPDMVMKIVTVAFVGGGVYAGVRADLKMVRLEVQKAFSDHLFDHHTKDQK